MAKKFTRLRVLVVDDDSLVRWALTQTLVDSGYDVAEASDAAGALDLFEAAAAAEAFDAVLLDFRLPDSNDLMLLSRLRRIAPSVRIILMTAYGTPGIIRAALDLGASDVLDKPFEMHQIPGVVSAALALGA